MTFVAAFYTFSVELNVADRGLYTSFRLKVPRHELESVEHLSARMIAFLHCYRQGQTFTQEVSDPKEPTIVLKNTIGELLLWVHVGGIERRKLELSLKQHPRTPHSVYFFDEIQIHNFCHALRGSKSNWIEPVRFFLIDPEFLSQLASLERTSPSWVATFVDERLYLSIDGVDFESSLRSIDIWDEYQKQLLAQLQQQTDTRQMNPWRSADDIGSRD
ncbi:MAG: hypothetical protein RL326_332 [Pseudomonadota bacterium]|jgi:uncharacterized protein YaeQ